QVYTTGLARADKLVKRKVVERYKEKFFTKYPNLKDKYIIVYAPTFRGDLMQGLHYENLDIIKVLKQLDENCVIVYKMHPLLADASLKEGERIVNVSHEDLYMLLCACDCLITDYSSILFDYSLLGKKAICYASDYEDYQQTIGFNVQYQKEMPSKICTNEQELIEQLSECSFDEGKMKKFQEMFMPFDDGGNAKRVYAHIQKVMNS
ncbi:MAG: CDP-glycerol glycerophosphotransferase family protein, partial [Longicatena sp.]